MANSSQSSPDPTTSASKTKTKTILLIMGHCVVRGCQCISGESTSNLDHVASSKARCNRCLHLLSKHSSYTPPSVSGHSYPPARKTEPLATKPYLNLRHNLIDELITRLERYHLIRINGTPATGKTTTMKLLGNELLKRYPETPLYILSGWQEKTVRAAGGWMLYLQKQLGISVDELEAYPCYILLDEAQESYWDTDLWVQLFKSIEKTSPAHVVLFTCYGAGIVHGGGQALPTQTPMNFQLHQQISLRPVETYHHPGWRQVGLLLSENEAHEILDQYVPRNISNGADILTNELKCGLYLASGGHVGLLVSLVDALEQVPKSSYTEHPDQQSALDVIWKQGWLHGEDTVGENRGQGTRYVFPSQIHRWYCQYLLSSETTRKRKELSYQSPLEMAVDAIRNFNPCQLLANTSSGPLEGDGLQLMEDQYQKEFYRCLCPLLLEHQITMAPEYLIRTGVRSARIDFLVEPQKWGLELLRSSDDDGIRQQMQQFHADGRYFPMIRKKQMRDYVVLDFTQHPPQECYPEYRGHLYHIVFADDFRRVRVVDASDRSEVVDPFVLVENKCFFR